MLSLCQTKSWSFVSIYLSCMSTVYWTKRKTLVKKNTHLQKFFQMHSLLRRRKKKYEDDYLCERSEDDIRPMLFSWRQNNWSPKIRRNDGAEKTTSTIKPEKIIFIRNIFSFFTRESRDRHLFDNHELWNC